MVVVLQHNATPPGTLKTYKELSRWSRLEEYLKDVSEFTRNEKGNN